MHYFGPRKEHKPYNVCHWYGTDCPDKFELFLARPAAKKLPPDYLTPIGLQYRFNSMGFRGGEFDQHADIKLYTAGCSMTLGTGLKEEHTWSSVLTTMLAQHTGNKSAALLNLSEGGGSNDYIARCVLEACAWHRPDLVVILFTFASRKEYVDGEKVVSVLAAKRGRPASRYYQYYTDQEGMINALKNMLLVQFYCGQCSIPLLFGWVESWRWEEEWVAAHPICGPLLAALDPHVMLRFGIEDRDILCDKARDNGHPGPRTNEVFAKRIWHILQERYDLDSPNRPFSRISTNKQPSS
jgi:hypothetical protein